MLLPAWCAGSDAEPSSQWSVLSYGGREAAANRIGDTAGAEGRERATLLVVLRKPAYLKGELTMRAMRSIWVAAAVCLVFAVSIVPGACQLGGAGGLDLEGLGMGDLGGMGNLGMLGALAGLGGGGLGGAAQAPVTVIITQPVMMMTSDSIYIAYQGTITKFHLATLTKQAEATYPTQPLAATALQGASEGVKIIEDGPAVAKPALVPGAEPSTGP